MNFELSVPIRLYWDLFPLPAEGAYEYEAVCRDIVGLKILSLSLTDLGPEVSPCCIRILQELRGKGPAVSLTIAPQALTPAVRDRLLQLGVRNLLIRASSLAEANLRLHIFQDKQVQSPAGISFEVTAANWRELPALVSFCADNGIRLLTLPMQRLTGGAPAWWLEPDEKAELANLLQQIAIPPELKLTIHDPFQWKLFYPDVPFPDGGCQAANTMLYISPDGAVYPCPSLPVNIGRLTDTSLKEIACSPAKKETRRQILLHPSPCIGCSLLASCKGGCRGRALAVKSSLDSADPGCPT